MAKSYLRDTTLRLMAGIDPNTNLPTRIKDPIKSMSKDELKKVLRIIDEQDAVNRGT